MKLLVIGKKERVEQYTKDKSLLTRHEIIYVPVGTSDEDILKVGKDTEIILADAIGTVSKEVIGQIPHLRMIHSEGVAYHKIDTQAAKQRKIYVCNCKGMNSQAVAEQTILLMLSVLHDVCGGDRSVREGTQIRTKEQYMVQGSLRELGSCVIGLVGFGDIAKAAAKLAKAFGCKVLYYSRTKASKEVEAEYGVSCVTLDTLLAESDMVSLHVPVTAETEGMADAAFFRKMKKNAYLINTARGELVDEKALIAALEEGEIAGAGLDTLTGEPVQKDHMLVNTSRKVAEKIVFSCHIGGITGASFQRGYDMVWSDIQRIEAGERPDHIVNPW